MRPRERLLRRGINPKDESAIRNGLKDWSDFLSVWEHVFTGAVVAGLIIEYLAEITSFFSKHVAVILSAHDMQLREWGGLFVIIGVAGELWIGVRSSRVETDLREATNVVVANAEERAAEALRAAAEANLARANLETQLLRTIGPRTITPEQREHIATKMRGVSPDSEFSVVVFVAATLNIEDTKECMEFAWQLFDVFNARDSVYTLQDPFAWNANDIWIRLPSTERVPWGNLGRLIVGILRDEQFKVAGSAPFTLQPILWRAERDGSGKTIPTPDAVRESIGIVVAKRSQPMFRLD